MTTSGRHCEDPLFRRPQSRARINVPFCSLTGRVARLWSSRRLAADSARVWSLAKRQRADSVTESVVMRAAGNLHARGLRFANFKRSQLTHCFVGDPVAIDGVAANSGGSLENRGHDRSPARRPTLIGGWLMAPKS